MPRKLRITFVPNTRRGTPHQSLIHPTRPELVRWTALESFYRYALSNGLTLVKRLRFLGTQGLGSRAGRKEKEASGDFEILIYIQERFVIQLIQSLLNYLLKLTIRTCNINKFVNMCTQLKQTLIMQLLP